MADLLYGINPVREALQGSGREPLCVYFVKGDTSPRLQALIDLAKQKQLKISFLPGNELERMAGHAHHQGVLLKQTPFKYVAFEDLLSSWQKKGGTLFFSCWMELPIRITLGQSCVLLRWPDVME